MANYSCKSFPIRSNVQPQYIRYRRRQTEGQTTDDNSYHKLDRYGRLKTALTSTWQWSIVETHAVASPGFDATGPRN